LEQSLPNLSLPNYLGCREGVKIVLVLSAEGYCWYEIRANALLIKGGTREVGHLEPTFPWYRDGQHLGLTKPTCLLKTKLQFFLFGHQSLELN
jgi:hypothetical protein